MAIEYVASLFGERDRTDPQPWNQAPVEVAYRTTLGEARSWGTTRAKELGPDHVSRGEIRLHSRLVAEFQLRRTGSIRWVYEAPLRNRETVEVTTT